MEKRNKYRYELHCHTSEGSRCAVSTAEEIVGYYHRMGYSGICLTDHFSGNGTAPDDMPWDERVGLFYSIYQKAQDMGNKLGLSVFFGLEYSIAPDINSMSRVTGNDFLLLNINKDWLISSRDAFIGKTSKIFEAIREAGGFIVHAHPFCRALYIECIRLYPGSVDAIEVYNASDTVFSNNNSQKYARSFNIPETAGSDCHNINQMVLTGVETYEPCHTSLELITAIREHRTRIFRLNLNRVTVKR